MRTLSFCVATSLGFALSACATDPGEGVAKAEIAEATTEAAPAAGLTWHDVDASTSKLSALGAKVTAQHPIIFHTFTGQIGLTDGKVEGIKYTVEMKDLEADHPKLTAHLLEEDFFDVAKHPTSGFESTKIVEGSKTEGATHTVSGNLTIRGNSKAVTFPATIEIKGSDVTAKASFVIDRQDFKITYPGRKDDLIKDNVALTIELNSKTS
jgi:polyisoprenoid-binding protein YceI